MGKFIFYLGIGKAFQIITQNPEAIRENIEFVQESH